MHAEAVLLVDDGESEIVERDVLLEQRMGADQKSISPAARRSSMSRARGRVRGR